ncbi:hypothetical protein HII31_13187 [Pseudocercospora fuligena]|uniref:Uncharacterized protein n=1 Tax=Pseudocercospora fuligena TaxID=685502 RepID=A0A8H6R591_9PEZI|nr:hypothetical protein HII31_13187 [Pseudocercospora fuligena]
MTAPAQPPNNGHRPITAPTRFSTSDARTLYYERSETAKCVWIRASLDIRFAGLGVLTAELHDEFVRRHDEFMKDTMTAMCNAVVQRRTTQEERQSFARGLSPDERARISQLPSDQMGRTIAGMIVQVQEKQSEAEGEEDQGLQYDELAQEGKAKKKRKIDEKSSSQD